MPNWKWQGVKKDGTRTSGQDDVQNERELRRILRSRGIRPIKVSPPSILEIDLNMVLVEKGFVRPFGNVELLNFTKQMHTLVGAGIPILQTLDILYKQEQNPSLKVAVKKISKSVAGGKSLSDAMSLEKGFSRLYTNLIRAGEVGGVLDKILEKLFQYMEKQEKIKSQVKSALTYPTIVVIVGVIVIGIMLVFVVPKFTEMLTESGQEIPAVTQFVIDSSDFLKEYALHIIIMVISGFVFLSHFIRTDSGKPVWDRFIMQVPLFGSLVIRGNLSSFSRTLSTMLSSGVSLVDCLTICSQTLDNKVIARDVLRVQKQVEEGKSLADPLSKISYFPDMVSQMVKVGEQTGNLDQMFDRVAEVFDRDVGNTISAITKLIEPAILVVLGGVIALILIAMYMPIFMSAGGV